MNQSAWDTVEIGGNHLLMGGLIILIPLYLFTPFAVAQFVCILLLCLIISSKFYSEYLIRNIRIIRCDSELRVFKHEWVQAAIKIENHGLLPAFMLAISDTPGTLAVFKNQKKLCTLERQSWTLLSWQGLCSERGVCSIGPVIIRGSDPLGLFPFQLSDTETTRLFVYPAFHSIHIKNTAGIPLGNMISANPLYEDITRRRSLRPYQIGDEPRRINWKLSARSGGFMVNEYDSAASYPVMIFLNLDRNGYPVKKEGMYIERCIEAAAALCLKAERERQELGIIFYFSSAGEMPVIAPSAFTIVPILERLAALNWTGADHTPAPECRRSCARAMLDQGKHLPYGTRFLYTGPDLGEEAYISLNVLKKYHLYLEYLIIDERNLPHLVAGNSPRYKIKEIGNEIV